MGQKQRKEVIQRRRDSSFYQDLESSEPLSVGLIRKEYLALKAKYGLSPAELALLVEPKELTVPAAVFSSDACPLEALACYLKEEKKLALSEIAKKLDRAYSSVYSAYARSRTRNTAPLRKLEPSAPMIPLQLFSHPRLSVLECCVSYLHRKEGLRLNEIASLLSRDQRTIWTVLHRAERKLSHART